MEAVEAATVAAGQEQQPPAKVVEQLNPALQQQLNLDSLKTRAISLQDVSGQFSMVNLELYNIVEDIKNVSKAFSVHPKNVNAENATSMYTT
ncbi:hypothetical protein SASPL_109945 [Salvia splendens]|uniref:Uncharacterized protein n=1 Tax=Salvia splendens TaxID=180675 RepID=A0A8X9A2V3_SALSN|nr:hypothetical protein SASPL_109945 [Salvia splendens]